jgi:UDP-glucose 4-epimerase
VTGATGLLGRHVVAALRDRGFEPWAFCRTPDASLGCESVRGDVTDFASLLRALRESAAVRVAHLAALLTSASERDPRQAYQVNVLGTVHVVEAARLAGVEAVCSASSQAVYGEATGSVPENAPLNPRTLYGVTKLAAEQFGAVFTARHGCGFVALRLPLVYGFCPGRAPGERTVRAMVEAAATGRAVRVQGGDHRFGLVYVRDAADAVARAVAAAPPPTGALNVGGPEILTPREMAAIVTRVAPGARITVAPGAHPFIAVDGGLDGRRAAAELGYVPQWDFERGVREYLGCVRENVRATEPTSPGGST